MANISEAISLNPEGFSPCLGRLLWRLLRVRSVGSNQEQFVRGRPLP